MAGHFLLSKAARNFTTSEVDAMSEREVWQFFVVQRWGPQGPDGTQVCPCCGAIAKHIPIPSRRQWRCREFACGRVFSVTSDTKFADHKLPLKAILKAMVIFVTNVKGISASCLSRDLGVAYMTAFTLLHKLRESLLVSRDTTKLEGVVHIDGAHFSGRPRKPRRLAKKTNRQLRCRIGRTAYQTHPNRRIVMVLRELHPEKGRGARRTIVECVRAEDDKHARALGEKYVRVGATVMTDESPAYGAFTKRYNHFTVNHSVEFCTNHGVSNNQAESFFTRCRRLVWGQIHRITPKYMLDYMNEMAWREDRRRAGKKEQVEELLALALTTHQSRWWRGYWQRRNRSDELAFLRNCPSGKGALPTLR